ncbi:hypothetical protein [Shewanella sp. S1-58-MNA-CIBAN-0166]|uniref:hypothetical protein n=1 Tax=Shewanella sp. S1-58-MNA-CIBAN-0166 TaxID=3140467 RepID=UPI0033183A1A
MRIFSIILLFFLTACSHSPNTSKQDNYTVNDVDFNIEFGKIIAVDGFYEIRPDAFDIELENGEEVFQISQNIEEKFGVRIENINQKEYKLGYYIGFFAEDKNEYVVFSQGGYWLIAPPNNPSYEAFLWENDKKFAPGYYKFVVIVDNEEVLNVIHFRVKAS